MNFPGRGRFSDRTIILSTENGERGKTLWRVDIRDVGRSTVKRFTPVPHRTFREIADLVQEKIRKLSETVNPDTNPTDTGIERDVEELRIAGAKMAETYFGSDIAILQSWIAGGVEFIEFHEPSEGYVFPIEFCYFKTSEGGFFLGDKCIVVRIVPTDSDVVHADTFYDLSEDILPPIWGSLEVGYAEGHELNSACREHAKPTRPEDEEVYALKSVTELERIDYLYELKTAADRRTKFSPWLSHRKDILHFNGHTQDTKVAGLPSERGVRVRNGVLLLPDHFELVDIAATFDGRNVVFLNVCGGAYGALDMEDSIPAKLFSLQAGVVICTVGVVADAVGVAFATEFYKRFSTPGTMVHKAVLEARQNVNAELKHPLANLYTIVGSIDLSIREKLTTAVAA